MTKKPELTLLYSIARSYYVDKLSQSQIAEMENISRSQISRLLDRAEKLGIVSISVVPAGGSGPQRNGGIRHETAGFAGSDRCPA